MSDYRYLANKIKFIEDFIRNRLHNEFPYTLFESETINPNVVNITIKRETYEDLFRMLDEFEEYKRMRFNDFVDQILKSGILLIETAYKHRDK